MKHNRQQLLAIIRKMSSNNAQWFLPDTALMHAVLTPPIDRATETDVSKVFVGGQGTIAGAYRIGEMRLISKTLPEWSAKLSDSWGRYVRDEIEVYARCIGNAALSKQLTQLCPNVCWFVHDVLNFRLDDGSFFGEHLSNLEERVVTRNAVKLFLRFRKVIRPPFVDNPLQEFNRTCNAVVLRLWRKNERYFWSGEKADLKRLILLSGLLNSLDFEAIAQSGKIPLEERIASVVSHQFLAARKQSFCPALGGDVFVDQFLDHWLSLRKPTRSNLVYFTHKNGQLVVSLKCIEAILERCPGMQVVLAPKGAPYGSEATKGDIEQLLDEDEKSSSPIFSKIEEHLRSKRLVICADGPRLEGLHPSCLSQELCYYLQRAEIIFGEGQAYAEIRGWLKPTFIAFQVKGRVAEAIHGVYRGKGLVACIRLGYGALHFSNVERLPSRVVSGGGKMASCFHVFGQTTSDYCSAICSPNYKILLERFFENNERSLFNQLKRESETTGRTVASIILGSESISLQEVLAFRKVHMPKVFAMGGGGGFAQVTLKALQMLGLPVAAGVPATDNGGSTGKLQEMLSERFGYLFGMGDAAAILELQLSSDAKRPIFSYRIPEGRSCLVDTLVDLILKETVAPTFKSARLSDCPDYLSFVCEQLSLARIIDDHFLGSKGVPGFSVDGASVRNLAVLSALYKCGSLISARASGGNNRGVDENEAERAWFFLEQVLGLNPSDGKSIRTIPVTYDRAYLWAQYGKPIPEDEIHRLGIPQAALSEDRCTVWGQHYIDEILPVGKIVKFGVGCALRDQQPNAIRANETYLDSIRAAKLIVLGAGSLFSSQLSQLAIPGVMDALFQRKDARRVLILNHVCMNETLFYSLTDHIAAIEALANRVLSQKIRLSLNRPVQIGDLFTDVVVPRTIAREIDVAMRTEMTTQMGGYWKVGKRSDSPRPTKPEFIRVKGLQKEIFKNRHVTYLAEHALFREQQRVTDWELCVLSYLEQPPSLFHARSESGRYRGPVYAVQADYDYLLTHGIPSRNIYEVECIGMNRKILKAEGKLEIEEFPGLIPESLMGIFKILLQKGTNPVHLAKSES